MRAKRGFTLIELLIVVAIIGILAAIAIPNFLEAQVRSKVARVVADMRTVATALEIYRVDNNDYPPDPSLGKQPASLWWGVHLLAPLTSPIAYISTLPSDPFYAGNYWRDAVPPGWWSNEVNTFLYMHGVTFQAWAPMWEIYQSRPEYQTEASRKKVGWVLYSPGPDLIFNMHCDYDPTNGTVSRGDIYRFGP